MPKPPIVVLNGPTASGKSALAVTLAERLVAAGKPTEIVNADAMLVYRGMDIGTAKPTLAERAEIRHHLIDLWDVQHTATVAEFQTLARAVLADCRARGVTAVLTGGSALYLRAIVDQFEFPGTDPAVRAKWTAKLDAVGAEALHAQLAERAPASAAQIQPGNGRRIVRALELLELHGGHVATLPPWTYALDGVQQWGLLVPRDDLADRIRQRVERMWELGFVAEVIALEALGLRTGLTASRALGYRQVLAYLAGETSELEALEATVRGTRRLARKQQGWFRRDSRIVWVDPSEAVDVIATALGAV